MPSKYIYIIFDISIYIYIIYNIYTSYLMYRTRIKRVLDGNDNDRDKILATLNATLNQNLALLRAGNNDNNVDDDGDGDGDDDADVDDDGDGDVDADDNADEDTNDNNNNNNIVSDVDASNVDKAKSITKADVPHIGNINIIYI